jgi:hypothetical protein
VNRPVGTASQGDAFSDRVMAAVALVAGPSPTRSFLEAVRSGAGRDAAAALSVAWHLGTARGTVAPRVRARSLALIIAVASILASGSMVAASAARVIVPHVDRSKILLESGSVIVDAGPDSVERTDTSAGRPTPVTLPAPAVVVVPKPDSTEHQASRDRHDAVGSPAPAHGTTSAHADQPGDGDAESSSSGPAGHDGSDESDQVPSASDDDGHDQGDDGSEAGAAVDGAGTGQDDHGDTGSGGEEGPDGGDAGDGSHD